MERERILAHAPWRHLQGYSSVHAKPSAREKPYFDNFSGHVKTHSIWCIKSVLKFRIFQ